MDACANLANLIIERKNRHKVLKKALHKRFKSDPNLNSSSKSDKPTEVPLNNTQNIRSNGSIDRIHPPPLPNPRVPGSNHRASYHLPGQEPLPTAPGTCTLPRRAINRDESSSKIRSPSNPPNGRLPPPYNRHMPPDLPKSRRPYQPPPPPRIQEKPIPKEETLQTWKGSSHWNRDHDSGFESIHGQNESQHNLDSEYLGSKKSLTIHRDIHEVPVTETSPSKSTENLLNASRVPDDVSRKTQLNYTKRPLFGNRPNYYGLGEVIVEDQLSTKRLEMKKSEPIAKDTANNLSYLNGVDKRYEISIPPSELKQYNQNNRYIPVYNKPLSPYKYASSLKQYNSQYCDIEINDAEVNGQVNNEEEGWKSLYIREPKDDHRSNSTSKCPPDRNGLPNMNHVIESKHHQHRNKTSMNGISDKNHVIERNSHLSKNGHQTTNIPENHTQLIEKENPFKHTTYTTNNSLDSGESISGERNGYPETAHSDMNGVSEQNERNSSIENEVAKRNGFAENSEVNGRLLNEDRRQSLKVFEGRDNSSSDTLVVSDKPLGFGQNDINHKNNSRDKNCVDNERKGGGSPSTSWAEWTNQLQAYVSWTNSQLRKKPGRSLISDLRRDFQNGLVFADLIEIIDVGCGPDTPIAPDKTPSLARKPLASPNHDSETALRRQPSLTSSARSSSPVYENLPKRSSYGRWAYDSLRASHKFQWNREVPRTKTEPDFMNTSLTTTSSSRCHSLNASLEEEVREDKVNGSISIKNEAFEFWRELQGQEDSKKSEEREDSPFRYHTIHRISGRRKLPQIPGKASPSLSNTSRVTTPQGDHFNNEEIKTRKLLSNGSACSSNGDENSREPEGRSQNSSPATSIARIESWKPTNGADWRSENIKDYMQVANQLSSLNGLDNDGQKSHIDSAALRQEVVRHIFERQALETDKVELARSIQQKDNVISDLRQQIIQKDKTLQMQKTQIDESSRSIQNGKIRVNDALGRGQVREELQLVRDAIISLRSNFRDTDPNQHTLDTLEQAISVLMERNPQLSVEIPTNKKEKINRATEPNITKIIYFTERTVTPFMSTINKRIGEVTLRDFKIIFDRPGFYRFHFKNHDPEYGLVKEEIINDDEILPGVDGKIIAWVEDEVE